MGDDTNCWADEHKGQVVLDIIKGKITIDQASKSSNRSVSEITGWLKDAQRRIDGAFVDQAIKEYYEKIEVVSRRVVDAFEGEPTLEVIKEHVDGWLAEGHKHCDVTVFLANANPEESASRGSVEYIGMAYNFFLEGQKELRGWGPSSALNSFKQAVEFCDSAEERLQSVLDGTYVTEEEYYQNASANRRSAKAKAAGKTRAEKRSVAIKTELARLLNEKKPEGGWKSKAAAVKALEMDIKAFNKSIGRPLSPDNLTRTLPKWLSKDDGLNEVYERTKRV